MHHFKLQAKIVDVSPTSENIVSHVTLVPLPEHQRYFLGKLFTFGLLGDLVGIKYNDSCNVTDLPQWILN